jgi:hypothetical protein
MPGLFEADQAVPVKDYGEELYVVESHEIPKLRLLGVGDAMTQMLQDWEAETRGRIGFAGVKDGEDVSAYNSQAQLALVAYGCHQRETWKVSKVAGKVPSAGVKQQIKHQRKEALKRLREAMERSIGGTQEMQRGTSVAGYEQRGAFAWLDAALQSVQVVNAALRPAAACLHKTALDTLTAAAFETMIQASATQCGCAVNLKGFVGPALKSHMSDWTQKIEVTSTQDSLQSFNIAASEKRLLKMVNTFEFDAGTVEVMSDYNLACAAADGADTAYTPYSGLFLDTAKWSKRYLQKVTEFELPDLGGGPRGYADVLWMLKCGLPAGQMAVYTDSATT